MAPAVQAQSLSALTALAANPPKYPRNPTQVAQEPLVLYIARVPGSRDVFLSTLKPREKVITAHDIESSLYYFHVDSPNDEILRDSTNASEAGPVETRQKKSDGLLNGAVQGPQRKPLPPNAKSALGDYPESSLEVSPRFQPNLNGSKETLNRNRRPMSGNVQPHMPIQEAPPLLPPRRLLGPRPLHSRQQSASISASEIAPGKENVKPRRWSEQPSTDQAVPIRPPRPSPAVGNVSIETVAKSTLSTKEPYINEENGGRRSHDTKYISITLIRRDPGSGGQWNVGKVQIGSSDVDPNGSAGTIGTASSRREDVIILKITSIGYAKFAGREDEGTPKLVSDKDDVSSHFTEATPSSKPTANSSNEWPCFQRQILTKSSKPVSKTPSSHRNSFRSSLDVRRSSDHSITARPLPMQSPPVSPELSPTHPNAYTFTSPWNGTCEFTTGIAGRSLKCKHTLPSAISYPVSELRFNLPSSNFFNTTSSKQRPLSAPFRSSRSSSILLTRRSSNECDQDDHQNDSHIPFDDDNSSDTERMDLSLGQERAGGGFGGKKVKLGKLIVENEGLKMLDLVVAANIGVWWGVYGKVGRG